VRKSCRKQRSVVTCEKACFCGVLDKVAEVKSIAMLNAAGQFLGFDEQMGLLAEDKT